MRNNEKNRLKGGLIKCGEEEGPSGSIQIASVRFKSRAKDKTHTRRKRDYSGMKKGVDLTSHKSSAAILHKNSFLGEIDTTMTENDVSLNFQKTLGTEHLDRGQSR